MESEHIVKSFDADLRKLDSLILEMGRLAEAQLGEALDALLARDADLATRVAANDRALDALEIQVDAFAIEVLARRQPLAEDLRAVTAALKISANLERIGDHAKNVAKRAATLASERPPRGALATLRRMGDLVRAMITQVVDAHIRRDAPLADAVRARDVEVDLVHTTLFRELLTHMMEDPRQITGATHLLFIAKHLERVGDHATNIAETVHFLVTGAMPEDEREIRDAATETVVRPAG